MNKLLDKLNIVILIMVIVISIITISNNFKKAFQHKYYLNIDSNNKEYIQKIVSENYKLTGTLKRISCMQGLGDWYLFLYYENGTEDNTIYSDSNEKMQPLQDYIRENGYNEGKVSWNKIKISFWTTFVTIIYEISYLIIKKIRRKQQK